MLVEKEEKIFLKGQITNWKNVSQEMRQAEDDDP